MTAVPLLEDSPAGRAAKLISDFLYLDTKNSEFVLETLQVLSNKEWQDGFDAGEFHANKREDTDD